MHITILWPDVQGYVRSGVEALRARGHHVTVWLPQGNDEGDGTQPPAGFLQFSVASELDDELAKADLVLSCGWHIARFRAVVRRARQHGVPTAVYFDTQWTASVRQRARRIVARRVLPILFDRAFVPGPRQADVARHLGFEASQVVTGALTFDAAEFTVVPRIADSGPRPNFVFVGRLVVEKGLDVLLAAYQSYRRRSDDPWGLIVVGDGPLKTSVIGPGVTSLPFSPAAEVAGAMSRSSSFVLPSRFEPFGVVLVEAAAAGLPIITTDRCGGASVVVDRRKNGVLVAPDDVEGLAEALLRVSALDPAELSTMGEHGRELAAELVPDRWADHVEELVRRASTPRRARWTGVAAALAGLGA